MKKVETVVREFDTYLRNYEELQYQTNKSAEALKKKATKLKNSSKRWMESFSKRMDNYEKYSKLQLAEKAYETMAKVYEWFSAFQALADADKENSYFLGVIKGCKDSEAIQNKCKVKIKEVCLEIEDYEKFFDNECLRED